MTDQLITLETAEMAYRQGFEFKYQSKGIPQPPGFTKGEELPTKTITIDVVHLPTQSLLVKWLREYHTIHVSVTRQTIGSDEWVWAYEIEYLPKDKWNAKRRSGEFIHKNIYSESPGGTYSGGWDTYEEALEEGLKAALKLIET